MKLLWRLLGILGTILFLLCAFTPLPNLLSRHLGVSSRIEPAGAIVVLGAGVDQTGELGADSLRRTVRGIVLQREGLAPLLVLLGPASDGGPPEAEVRAGLAHRLGVPAEAVLTVPLVRTTHEEASRVQALLQPRGVRRILLVTNSQHMLRAKALFERAGFGVLPVTADEISDTADAPEGRLKLTRVVLQESLALVYYRVAGYL